ncbi:hypothetical protein PPERSA_06670 [Pseudocohnilembus persalinus]|uniref:Uncharacterized protein n=1 Tax=Pseudocohnilembus persalinus TaxID=266149 RepID=A0A0V0QS32_PSEPJ|nr:hypothetical protein PPERSA_06670 [Pseudocohnilembus persalinus]|eukprot:KRX05036.1 hypothetical protein PPERSA_06670 [Pseudocohnilembus persalinus]
MSDIGKNDLYQHKSQNKSINNFNTQDLEQKQICQNKDIKIYQKQSKVQSNVINNSQINFQTYKNQQNISNFKQLNNCFNAEQVKIQKISQNAKNYKIQESEDSSSDIGDLDEILKECENQQNLENLDKFLRHKFRIETSCHKCQLYDEDQEFYQILDKEETEKDQIIQKYKTYTINFVFEKIQSLLDSQTHIILNQQGSPIRIQSSNHSHLQESQYTTKSENQNYTLSKQKEREILNQYNDATPVERYLIKYQRLLEIQQQKTK